MSNFEQIMAVDIPAIELIIAKNLHPFDESNEIRKLHGMDELTLGQWILQNRHYENRL